MITLCARELKTYFIILLPSQMIVTTIEMAHQRGWKHLWLECDSMLVIEAFENVSSVPWQIRNRWMNILE